jgi:hypothetical protein
VAILWPSERDKYIKKLTDGNERIIAAEIQTKNKPICLINVYFPTKMANSDNQYQENLYILQTMIDKYVDSHTNIRLWDQSGRPRDGHNLFLDKTEAKKALRKQQRKERAIERELFMKKLESKPDQKTFFQLIRKNHAEVR